MLPRAHLLIVDDEPDTREALSDLLVDEGYAVLLAADATEALKRARELPRPGLILLDYGMPKQTGFELLEELGRDPDLATIPVIVFTVWQRLQHPGVRAIIQKGAPVEEVLAAIESALGVPPATGTRRP